MDEDCKTASVSTGLSIVWSFPRLKRLYLPSSSDELGTKPAALQCECDTRRVKRHSERRVRSDGTTPWSRTARRRRWWRGGWSFSVPHKKKMFGPKCCTHSTFIHRTCYGLFTVTRVTLKRLYETESPSILGWKNSEFLLNLLSETDPTCFPLWSGRPAGWNTQEVPRNSFWKNEKWERKMKQTNTHGSNLEWGVFPAPFSCSSQTSLDYTFYH